MTYAEELKEVCFAALADAAGENNMERLRYWIQQYVYILRHLGEIEG